MAIITFVAKFVNNGEKGWNRSNYKYSSNENWILVKISQLELCSKTICYCVCQRDCFTSDMQYFHEQTWI